MGQKTHPYGFRVGVIKTWSSKWYEDGKTYQKWLHQDIRIKRAIKQYLYNANIAGVEIERADGAGQFESVTLRPHAKLAAGSDENIARRLHDAAAEKCFIARSVSFQVEHEPTFEIASA